MCAEYNVGGGGDTGKGLHKSLAFLFLFGIEGGESHLNSIGHAVGPEMLVVGVAEAPRNSAFSWSWIKIGFRASPGCD